MGLESVRRLQRSLWEFGGTSSAVAIAVFLAVSPSAALAQDRKAVTSPAPISDAAQEQTVDAATDPTPGSDPQQPPASETDSTGADIVVTGSRLSTGFTAPTPVTTVGAAEIETRAASNLGEVLTQIPSFRPTNSPSTAGVTSRGGGQQITPDLRGIGDTRTLVLVNGRRHVPSTSSGSVDIKLIPTLLVKQIEVVTGGASAAYGSDAVAGVVNFILKDRIDGIEGTIQSGISERGDGEEIRGSLATGFTFAGDRGRFVIGADYLKLSGIGNQLTRDFGRREVGLITNPNFATNGLPNFIISENVRSAITTPGGLVVSGPLRGLAFGPNGTTFQYNFGQVFGSTMIGGDGRFDNENLLSLLGVPVETLNALARAEFDISDNLKVFTELSGGLSQVGGASQEPRDRGNLVIRRDNAFLPESVRAAIVANNLQTITIGRVSNDTGKIKLDRKNKLIRGVIGLQGELGGEWSWDAYYQYGRNDFSLVFGPNNRKQDEFRLAVDAVRSPGGQIVCRSTLTSPNNGCIPVNVFGDGSLQLNDFVNGSALFDQITEQHVASANIQGKPFSTWAGPVSVGVGVEYRRDTAVGTSDPVSQRQNPNGSVGGFIIGNQLPFEGKINVSEFYGETLIPLADDVPFARELNLSAAARRTHYSTSGAVVTWKVGLSYKPINDLRFRVTRSRDIRAPNISELFENGGSSNTNVFDPVLGQAIQVRELNRGNPNLQPEIADTFTAGAVFQPSFAPRLALSVDYYKIKIEDVISTIGAPILAQGCFAGNRLFCESIAFRPDGSIDFITNQGLNLASLDTSGIDLELRYGYRPSWLPGEIRLRTLATYVDELTVTNPNGPQIRVGQVSDVNRVPGVPHWSGNGEISYVGDRWTLGLQARYVGKGKFSNLYTEGAGARNTVNDNSVPAYVYFSLNTQYNIKISPGRQMQFFAVVNNLLDQEPPFIPSGAAGGTRESSTNPVFYDVIGRFYRFGLRFNY